MIGKLAEDSLPIEDFSVALKDALPPLLHEQGKKEPALPPLAQRL